MIICRSLCFGLTGKNDSAESQFQNLLLTEAWYSSWRSVEGGSRFPQVSQPCMTDLFNPHRFLGDPKIEEERKQKKRLYIDEDYLVDFQISCFTPFALLTCFFQHPI